MQSKTSCGVNQVAISIAAIEDSRLSFDERGLFFYIASLVGQGITKVSDLRLGIGRDALYKKINTLKEYGYISVKAGIVYVIDAIPEPQTVPENSCEEYYNSAEWKELSSQCLERDNYTCGECQHRGGRLVAHHIVFRNNSGADALHNLISMCASCHTRLHANTRRGNNER